MHEQPPFNRNDQENESDERNALRQTYIEAPKNEPAGINMDDFMMQE